MTDQELAEYDLTAEEQDEFWLRFADDWREIRRQTDREIERIVTSPDYQGPREVTMTSKKSKPRNTP